MHVGKPHKHVYPMRHVWKWNWLDQKPQKWHQKVNSNSLLRGRPKLVFYVLHNFHHDHNKFYWGMRGCAVKFKLGLSTEVVQNVVWNLFNNPNVKSIHIYILAHLNVGMNLISNTNWPWNEVVVLQSTKIIHSPWQYCFHWEGSHPVWSLFCPLECFH